MAIFNRELTQDRIDAAVGSIQEHSDDDRLDEAWEASKPLRKVAGKNRGACEALLRLLQNAVFSREHSQQLATQLFESRGHEPWALGDLGGALEAAHDMRYLNAAPPTATVFANVASALRSLAPSVSGTEDEYGVLMGLCNAARLMGRSWDDVAEKAYLRLVELKPESWARQYDLGLFYKTRGKFAEGLTANKAAAKLGGHEDDAVIWNLGICATGAGDGATALSTWKDMGQKIEMGRFALPEGGYGSAKVRLAERPLATRNVAEEPDDPGQEETIWIERLSPCHGIVNSALYHEIGVDYGDVVLFDGAPITSHSYEDESVPVFPHLATIRPGGFAIYNFGGTQERDGQIYDMSESLPDDAVLYTHTEQVQNLCTACWESEAVEHSVHDQVHHGVVTGKLCVPETMSPGETRERLDALLAEQKKVRLFIPDLSLALGDTARAEVESRRLGMILDS